MREDMPIGKLSGTWLPFPPHPVGLVLLWTEPRGPSVFNQLNGKDEAILEEVLLGPWILSDSLFLHAKTEGNRNTQELEASVPVRKPF